MTHPDCTVAIDDQLCERFHRCLRCGHVAQWQDIREVAGRAWFACLCWDCWSEDRDWQGIDALLRARYGADDACSARPGSV
jgi:hypothetical protein